MNRKWIRVTKKHPCPICGKPDWCTYTADGGLVLCMRQANDRPSKGQAGGWLYKIGNAPFKTTPSTIYAAGEDEHIPKRSVKYLLQDWKRDTNGMWLAQLAKDLGVKRAALERLGCVWCEGRSCWAFPMRDEAGNPIGVRFRSRERKYSVRGSRTGLFFDPGMSPGNTCAWLTEGPTDTAALMSIGAKVVIGRSDLLSAWPTLKKALARFGITHVNICVDDEGWEKEKTNSPGRDGSVRLAKAIGMPCKIVRVPGYKDIREFVKAGGTMTELGQMLKYQSYVRITG